MCQTVITTMKTYGLILADNGSNWYFQGTADTRWTYDEVDQLKQIPASDFVAVDESCLMVSARTPARLTNLAAPATEPGADDSSIYAKEAAVEVLLRASVENGEFTLHPKASW